MTADFMAEKGQGRARITTFERDRFNDLMQEFGVSSDAETYAATVFGRIELFPRDNSLGPSGQDEWVRIPTSEGDSYDIFSTLCVEDDDKASCLSNESEFTVMLTFQPALAAIVPR